MKRIVMIPPFEVLTGNLSGKQNLQYAENNNPAYEAPNGSQGARNYVARYVGAKRSDGKTYFSVRRKNTAFLNGLTRMQMALIGSIAAIKSTIQKNDPQTWDDIKNAYVYAGQHGQIAEGVTFTKWVDENLRLMLRYHRNSWAFNQASISFEINNPFRIDNASALVISQKIWLKFASVLAYSQDGIGGKYFTIDGKQFFAPTNSQSPTGLPAWGVLINNQSNPNLHALLTGIAENSSDQVTYLGAVVYNGSTAVASVSNIDAAVKYSTVQA